LTRFRKFIKYKEKYIVSDDGEVWEIQKNNLNRIKKGYKLRGMKIEFI